MKRAFLSTFLPTAIAYHTLAFPNCEQTIDRQALEALMLAAGPKYFKVGGSGRSQAEMQPGIVAGEETGLTKYSLSLRLSAVMSYDSSSYRTAVGIHAFQLNFNPVGFSRKVVSQQRRWLIEIDDDDVQVAIIIEIAESASAAAMCCGYARPSFLDQLFKHAFAQVSKNGARRLIRVLRKLFLNSWIYVPRRHEQIRPAVIVQINDAGAPANEPRFNSQSR